MKRNYELVLIVDGSLNDAESQQVFEKYRALINSNHGEFVQGEQWQRRKLAYPMRNKQFGVYYIYYFTAEPETLTELKRQLSFDEFALRYLLLKVKNLTTEHTFFQSIKQDPFMNHGLYYELNKGDV